MTSLTRAALVSKDVAIAIVVFLVAVLAFFLFTSIGKSIISVFSPPKPAPPTAAFGKLPPLDFSGGYKPPDGVVYTLETVSGDLPKLETIANVFEVISPGSSFGDLAKAKAKAVNMGFVETPVDTSAGIAKFTDKKNLNKTLSVEISGGNFEIASNYLTKIEVLSAKPGVVEETKRQVDIFSKSGDLGNILFANDKTNLTNYKIDGSKLTEVSNAAQANLVAVKFNRADIEKKKVVYDNFNSPEFWVMLSQNEIVAAHNGVQNVELNKFATYPLKGLTKAYDELKKGNAIYNRGDIERFNNIEITTSALIRLKPYAEKKFSIFTVELAYMVTTKPELYLQPVYVFNSDNGLAAYVSAVDDTWIDHSAGQ